MKNILILHDSLDLARTIVEASVKDYMKKIHEPFLIYWANKTNFCKIYPDEVNEATFPSFINYSFIHRSHADILDDTKIKNLVETAELVIVFGGGSQVPILNLSYKKIEYIPADKHNLITEKDLKLILATDINSLYKA